MPFKPVKRCYKIWYLCNSTNGYVYNFQIYTGTTPGAPEDNLGAKVVKAMMEPLEGKGYHLFMDNFFSSVGRFGDLKQKGTLSVEEENNVLLQRLQSSASSSTVRRSLPPNLSLHS